MNFHSEPRNENDYDAISLPSDDQLMPSKTKHSVMLGCRSEAEVAALIKHIGDQGLDNTAEGMRVLLTLDWINNPNSQWPI